MQIVELGNAAPGAVAQDCCVNAVDVLAMLRENWPNVGAVAFEHGGRRVVAYPGDVPSDVYIRLVTQG